MAVPKPARLVQDNIQMRVTVKYQSGGTGLRDAYRILAKNILNKRGVKCGSRSISG